MVIDDIEDVRRLYIPGWQNAFTGIVPQDYPDNMNLDNRVPPIDGAYVLTDGQTILGTSSISAARDDAFAGWGEIISIFILPELIGQGYGHILFEYVKNELPALGYTQLYPNVFEANMHVRCFYEKHGFAWNNERFSLCIGGENLTELRYIISSCHL